MATESINKKKERVTKIKHEEKMMLFEIFVSKRFDEINPKDSKLLKAIAAGIIASFVFASNLESEQIIRQLKTFCGNVKYRKQIGLQFRKVTLELCDPQNTFIKMSIVPKLASVFRIFQSLSQLHALPQKVFSFLKVCHSIWMGGGNDGNRTANDYNPTIDSQITSIELYIRNILYPLYTNIWTSFSRIESINYKSTMDSPDTVLSNLEYDLSLVRCKWIEGHISSNLCPLKLFETQTILDMFYKLGEEIKLKPLFVRNTVINNDSSALNRVLFSALESETFKYYKRNVALHGNYLFSDEKYRETDTRQITNTNTTNDTDEEENI
jgi:hypothetical protein